MRLTDDGLIDGWLTMLMMVDVDGVLMMIDIIMIDDG